MIITNAILAAYVKMVLKMRATGQIDSSALSNSEDREFISKNQQYFIFISPAKLWRWKPEINKQFTADKRDFNF